MKRDAESHGTGLSHCSGRGFSPALVSESDFFTAGTNPVITVEGSGVAVGPVMTGVWLATCTVAIGSLTGETVPSGLENGATPGDTGAIVIDTGPPDSSSFREATKG